MKTVVGLYDQFEDAQSAVKALRDADFSANDINMVASDENGRYSRYLNGDPSQKEDVKSGAGKGAGLGAVLGGLGGLLAGLGALTIPVIGPVIAAGPIVTTLVGAGAGAVAGGIVGALVDIGVPEDRAKDYAEGIRRGGTLVTVQAQVQQASKADAILRSFNPVDIDERSQQWKQGAQVPVTGEHDVHRHDQSQMETTSQDKHIPVTGHQANATVPVVEEDQRVAKREADRGGGRVESHTAEVPVEKGVNMERTGLEWNNYDQRFRQDYQSRFGSGQYQYNYYQPVYRLGYDLANNPQFKGYDWTQMEPIARREYQRRSISGSWQAMKEAVRFAWESAANRA
jgi:hypothetical protein